MKFLNFALTMAIASVLSYATQYEAENATLENGATASGNYVKMYDGNITFNVNVSSAGMYNLVIRFSQSYGTMKEQNLYVNGSSIGVLTFKNTGSSSSWENLELSIKLNQGNNTIAITHSWGWVDIDYITIESSEAKEYTFNISNTIVTQGSTESAQKLYKFLAENFGKKTISGVMTGSMENYSIGSGATNHEDVKTVYNASGKYPAIVGIDFLNATGASATVDWNLTYTNKTIDIAKSIWQQGGIPAITWHWRPGSLDDFYVEKINFDFTQGFISGTTNWDENSSTYKTLVNDIDKIAVLLQQLQDAGVAAIFRPIHEASGAWFWWGAKGGAAFQSLYRLIYDRLVNVKGIKNLVWVWNPEHATDTDWNPGSQYYDVISIDIYNAAYDYGSNYIAFDNMAENLGTDKILALSENGPIPDVSNMIEDKAQWSWWMPWYNSWGNTKFISQTSNTVWQTNMASEYIITLDEMPGWGNVIVGSSSSNNVTPLSSSSETQVSSSSVPPPSSSSITPSSSSVVASSSSSAAISSSSNDVPPPSSSSETPSSSSIIMPLSSNSVVQESSSSMYFGSSSSNALESSASIIETSSSNEPSNAIGVHPLVGFTITIQNKQLEIIGTESANVDVFDLQGRPLFNQKNVAHQVSLDNLNNGVYIIRVQTGAQTLIRKFQLK